MRDHFVSDLVHASGRRVSWPAETARRENAARETAELEAQARSETAASVSDAFAGVFGFFALLALPATPRLTPARDLSGAWLGSANLTSEWRDQRCDYRGAFASVQLWVAQGGSAANGGLRLSIPVAGGSSDCRPLQKTFTFGGAVSGTRLTFVDPAGNSWRLSFTSTLLGGRVDFTGGGPNPSESLAVGTSRANGDTPLTRLRGSVTLRRQTAADAPRLARARVAARSGAWIRRAAGPGRGGHGAARAAQAGGRPAGARRRRRRARRIVRGRVRPRQPGHRGTVDPECAALVRVHRGFLRPSHRSRRHRQGARLGRHHELHRPDLQARHRALQRPGDTAPRAHGRGGRAREVSWTLVKSGTEPVEVHAVSTNVTGGSAWADEVEKGKQ